MANIYVRKSRAYNYLSANGTEAIRHECGKIDHEAVADEAQMIIQSLTGKGYTAADAWVILYVADQAIQEWAKGHKI